MVVVSSLQTNLHYLTCHYYQNHHLCNSSKASLFYSTNLNLSKEEHSKPRAANNGVLHVKGYMEDNNTISDFVNKVIGSLPLVGLVARILTDEGGVGGDLVDFAEFRRRVGNKSSGDDSAAFIEFQDRRGRAGDPLYVLLCCWLAAVGAGLLKSEEILEGATRLRLSNDIEFEEETFLSMMNEAKERRAKMRAPVPTIPMDVRAEKALEAIYVCCYGTDAIGEDDEGLLCTMLNAVFPSVGQGTIETIIKEKIKKVRRKRGNQVSRAKIIVQRSCADANEGLEVSPTESELRLKETHIYVK